MKGRVALLLVLENSGAHLPLEPTSIAF